MADLRKDLQARKRFWSFVQKQASGCWHWVGALSQDDGGGVEGYGMFWFGGRAQRAHRLAWVLLRGPIPKGMVLRHKCDNPRCVNPDHLEPGTQMDNVRDMLEREREAKGEKNGAAKLTEAQVRAIRQRWREREINEPTLTKADLMRQYKVSHKLIRLVLTEPHVIWIGIE